MQRLISPTVKIFESSLLGVITLTSDSYVLDVNEKAAEILQCPVDLIQDQSVYYIFDQDFPHLEPEKISEGVWTGLSHKKQPIAVQYSFIPVADHDHCIGYVVLTELPFESSKQSPVTSYNIPENNISNTLVNSLPGVFYLFNTKGKYLKWNRHLEQVTGYDHFEIENMHPLNFFQGTDKAAISSKIQEVFKTKENVSIKANLVTKCGRGIPYLFSGTYLSYMGEDCLLGLGVDISQRIKAEKSLEHSNKQLKTAQQIARIGYWEWNWIDKKTYWSDEMYALCGVDQTNGPLGEIDFAKNIHKEDLAYLETERKRIVKTRKPGRAEFRYYMSNGEMRHFSVRTSAVLDKDGNFASLEGTLHDISDRKRAAEAVIQSNERYELISQATNDAIWDWDINNNHIKGNENLYELFGLRDVSDRFDDKMFQSRIHPDDVDRVRENVAEALFEKKNVITQEYRFLHPDGSWKVILERSQVIYDQSVPTRMLGAMQDITEQKASENNLQKTTNRLLLATTSAKLGIFDWDIVQDELVWNQYMYEIFEVDPSDFDHKFQSWLNCFHSRDIYKFELNRNTELLAKRKLRETIRIVLSNEEIRHIEIHAVILPDHLGKVSSVIGVCRDITDMVNAEQKINRAIINTQEEERFETGRELHDNVIQVLIASLMNLNQVNETITGNHALDTGITHTKNAINEIRKLSHQLAPSNLGLIAMDEAIRDLVKNMNSDGRFEVNLGFDIDFGHQIPDDIKLNIYRIVQEQLNNINKHSNAKHIDLELIAGKNRVTLRTRDDGKGFDLDQVKKGIGLHNIQRRVKIFEGDITINTAPNSGCEILIDIPIS